MAKFVVKNSSFWVSTAGAKVAVTGLTAGAATIVTVANALAAGDYATVTGSGWASVDGKVGRVTAATATELTIELNSAGETAGVGVGAQATLLPKSAWTEACLAGFDISGGAADSVAVGTFCEPSAAIAGAPGAQTMSVNGFVDPKDPGYLELQKASIDGTPRFFRFVFPKASDPNGAYPPEMVFEGTVGGFDLSMQVGQPATFSSSITLAGRPTFVTAP